MMLGGFISHFMIFKDRLREYENWKDFYSMNDSVRMISQTKQIADEIFYYIRSNDKYENNILSDFVYLNLLNNLITHKVDVS